MGVLGEYLWRAHDEARRRPRYLIEARAETLPSDTGQDGGDQKALVDAATEFLITPGLS